MTGTKYWEKLKKTGWLEYVPSSQLSDLRARINKACNEDPESAHLCLAQSGFDAECIEGPDAYRKILDMLAKDSRKLFRPTTIREESIKLTGRRYALKVSFRYRRMNFAVTVPHESDWFEMPVLDLVNSALEASGAQERFLVLPSDGQLIFLAIIPRPIFDKAVAAKLIPAVNDE